MNDLINQKSENTEKKNWIKPEVELISSEEIQGGKFITRGPERSGYRVS